jgi:hypothetical protein
MGFDLRVIKIEEFFHTDAREASIDLATARGFNVRAFTEFEDALDFLND